MIRFTFLDMNKRKIRLLFQLIVILICFYMIDVSWTQWNSYYYFYDRNLQRYQFDPDASGRIDANIEHIGQPSNTEVITSMWMELGKIEGIKRYGSYFVGDVALDDHETRVKALYIIGDLWEMGRLSFQEGGLSAVQQWSVEDSAGRKTDGCLPILVGADLEEQFRLGKKVDLLIGFDTEDTLTEVTGVLERGASWFTGTLPFFSADEVSLDDAILLPASSVQTDPSMIINLLGQGNIFFETEDPEQYKVVSLQVREVMNRIGYKGATGSVRELLDYVKEKMDDSFGPQKAYAVMIFLITMMYLLTARMIAAADRKRVFGIMGICGFRRGQILGSILLENIILVFTAAGVTYLLRYAVLRQCLDIDMLSGEVRLLVHSTNTFWVLLAASIGLILIVSIFPYLRIRNKNIVQLLQSQ